MSHDRGCPCGREPYEYQDCQDPTCSKREPEKFGTLVFIGRFQPFHNGHHAVVKQALSLADRVVLVIGSSFKARDIRDPFTFEERRNMIEWCFREEVREGRLRFVAVRDYPYDDSKWVAAVQRAVEGEVGSLPGKIGLIGHAKDHTSFYLKIFPMWGSVSVPNVQGINATDIRASIFEKPSLSNLPIPLGAYMVLIDTIINLEHYDDDLWKVLCEEYRMIQDYREAWKAAPYAPTFVTVDAVVVQSGHVLLVKRKASPGKGLWALPGGFLNQEETLLDGAIRELREETRIKVPAPVLRGSVVGQKTFDAPNRSLRGRTITTAFHIDLGYDTTLPKVKGSDDAEKAKWVPFNQVRSDQMFEDHFSILDHFLKIA